MWWCHWPSQVAFRNCDCFSGFHFFFYLFSSFALSEHFYCLIIRQAFVTDASDHTAPVLLDADLTERCAPNPMPGQSRLLHPALVAATPGCHHNTHKTLNIRINKRTYEKKKDEKSLKKQQQRLNKRPSPSLSNLHSSKKKKEKSVFTNATFGLSIVEVVGVREVRVVGGWHHPLVVKMS